MKRHNEEEGGKLKEKFFTDEVCEDAASYIACTANGCNCVLKRLLSEWSSLLVTVGRILFETFGQQIFV